MLDFEEKPRKGKWDHKTWLTVAICALVAVAIAFAVYFLVLRSQVSLLEPETPDRQDQTLTQPPQIITASDPVGGEAQPEEPAEPDSPEVPEAPTEPDPEQPPQDLDQPEVPEEPEEPKFDAPLVPVWSEAGTLPPAAVTEDTLTLDLQVYSENVVLIDLATNTVLAEKGLDDKIYPASMTKVMTALVACELIQDWTETFTMTQAIIDPLFLADATMAGFVNGEEVNMMDLVYGVILPSGAEATEGLALHLVGSEEAFVEKMNEKAAELGLEHTHFVDASGFHDEDHYTTLRDMAIILQAAMDNDICRQILSTPSHTSAPTEQNPEGVDMYNKFLLRAENADQNGALIVGAKTGYTTQAMNCCASFGYTPDGRAVVCVTAHAWTGDFCLADHIALYSQYSG